MSDNEDKTVNELKYEGLAALIVQGQENAEKRHDDFAKFVDHRFNKIDQHNTKQNGDISRALKGVQELESESDLRKQTCQKTVQIMEQQIRYGKFVKWVDEHPGKSITLVFTVFLVTEAVIVMAISYHWLDIVWKALKGIF